MNFLGFLYTVLKKKMQLHEAGMLVICHDGCF